MESIGNINCVIAKELTKIHEQFIRGNISEVVNKFNQEEIKGEYIILLDLNNNSPIDELDINNKTIEEQYKFTKNKE